MSKRFHESGNELYAGAGGGTHGIEPRSGEDERAQRGH